ncbi:DUF2793 domain-containing protein [Labrenzia sp. CE80]|uniref:DUF2793 domain-containing protein n=1 Tax=Labrenzia sp. CE80 TaxID=1788986 RepID=UPI00138A4591|nr:DUF2793 domain-containing protein [Labrenzia sp. CE80]
MSLVEQQETFELGLLDGGSVVQAVSSLTTPGHTGTAARQIAGSGSSQPSNGIRIFQISDGIGRGSQRGRQFSRGDWAGQDGQIASYADRAWAFYPPVLEMIAYVADEGTLAVYTGVGWKDYDTLLSEVATVSRTASGAESRIGTVEEELTGLSGASVDTSIVIPNQVIVFGVSTRTTTTITGACSYDCGISGETSKFGGSLGVAEGSNNAGLIGSQAFYSDTAVRLTTNGGSFTGGAVKMVLHYFLSVVPAE